MQDILIDYLKKHRLSTAEVGDALGKKGAIENVSPLIDGLYIVGKVFYTSAYAESNWMIHNDIIDVPKDSVVFIENLDGTNKALFGEIVSRFIIERKKAQAIVTNGKIRDKSDIKSLALPIWHIGTSPIGCYNSKPVFTDSLEELARERRNELEGSILVCDDDGVVIINKEDINKELIKNIEKLRDQENIWKECVFNKGWDTFETICIKRYLNEQ